MKHVSNQSLQKVSTYTYTKTIRKLRSFRKHTHRGKGQVTSLA